MYDITNENTFTNIRDCIKQIEENGDTNICKILVGNNCHKPDRKVTYEEGKKLAKDFNMGFFESSYITKQNADEAFNYLALEILKIEEANNIQKNIKIKDKNNSENRNKCH